MNKLRYECNDQKNDYLEISIKNFSGSESFGSQNIYFETFNDSVIILRYEQIGDLVAHLQSYLSNGNFIQPKKRFVFISRQEISNIPPMILEGTSPEDAFKKTRLHNFTDWKVYELKEENLVK